MDYSTEDVIKMLTPMLPEPSQVYSTIFCCEAWDLHLLLDAIRVASDEMDQGIDLGIAGAVKAQLGDQPAYKLLLETNDNYTFILFGMVYKQALIDAGRSH